MQLLDVDFVAPNIAAPNFTAPNFPAPNFPAPNARWDSENVPARAALPVPAPAVEPVTEPIVDPLILDPDFGPPPALTSALREHARLLRRRLESHPDIAARQAAEALASAVVSAVMSTLDVVNTELGDVMRAGLVLSSGRPGLKKMGITMTDRLDPKRRVECAVQTALAGDELALSAECLGQMTELARVKLGDPRGANTLRTAAETHLLKAAGQFAEAAGDGRAGRS